MLTIGPYRFTEHDARRTIGNYPTIWAQLCEGRDAAVLAPLEVVPTGDLRRDLEAVWSSLVAAGPALRAAGQLPASVEGRVAQLSRSGGGVPKTAVAEVTVGWAGVDGDVHAARQHHGRPWQALCLWSTEVIDALNRDGHHLAPGAAGENITISGLPWEDVRPGVRLRIGDVVCEATAFAEPCTKNARWFAGGDFRAMHASKGAVSRVYATVLEPGRIRAGDPAILEP